MAENPPGRSFSGSSLTRKRGSKVVLGTMPHAAEADAVRAVLKAASGGVRAEDRLQIILDCFQPTLAESYGYGMSTEEMHDPTPRHGPFVHPDEKWYQCEIALRLRKALSGADPSMRAALALAFGAGELFQQMDLEEAGLRLDQAVVQAAGAKAQFSEAAEKQKAEAARLYAPALAEAKRRWSSGRRISSSQMLADLLRLPAFRGLPKRSLELRLRELRKIVVRGHSESDK